MARVTAIIDGTGSIGAAVGPFLGKLARIGVQQVFHFLFLAGWLSGEGAWDRVFYMLMGANMVALVMLVRIVLREMREGVKRREVEGHKNYKTFAQLRPIYFIFICDIICCNSS